MSESFMFTERRNAAAFWLGSAIVAVGVLLYQKLEVLTLGGIPESAEL